MNSNQKLLWSIFWIYAFMYIFLYLCYNLIIHVLHSSFSVISVPAILLPYFLLLLFQLILWKNTTVQLKSERKVKRKFRAITILSIVPPLYCTVLLGMNEYKSYFSVEKWLSNQTERVYIVDDLFKKYNLNGMTIDEVTTLLGEPTETSYFKHDDNIVYYLGNERGLISIDSEWLVINFDDSNKVIKYAVVRD
ncbi:outer membrane protein assembly factor BamE [Bacillus sp. Bva_UNVM-123]|uniref:outer membrane protein assembly factor BamE domain-containing protein n=1 Tax=Bacillus sp. Bva_UNVM-123 TaxID=2829798 RepID=UPI00391F016E